MQIHGLTVCVGQVYASYLERSLRTWLETLDSLTVITDHNTLLPSYCYSSSYSCQRVHVVRTNIFTQYNAHFNKGAALCIGYGHMAITELQQGSLILHFDSDIIPPHNWRRLTEMRFTPGCLYGVQRISEEGKPLDETPIHPYAYWHLWHSSDTATWRWPLFEPFHPHAGNYDAEFAEMWPKSHRIDLGFKVTHIGEPRQNWFGPDTDKELINNVHKVGLVKTRELARKGQGRLTIPLPLFRFSIPLSNGVTWTKAILRVCSSFGPFTVDAKVFRSSLYDTPTVPSGFTLLSTDMSPAQLFEQIELKVNSLPVDQLSHYTYIRPTSHSTSISPDTEGSDVKDHSIG